MFHEFVCQLEVIYCKRVDRWMEYGMWPFKIELHKVTYCSAPVQTLTQSFIPNWSPVWLSFSKTLEFRLITKQNTAWSRGGAGTYYWENKDNCFYAKVLFVNSNEFHERKCTTPIEFGFQFSSCFDCKPFSLALPFKYENRDGCTLDRYSTYFLLTYLQYSLAFDLIQGL